MLFCCNNLYSGSFSKVIKNNGDYYRRVEFGVCPVCGVAKFREIRFAVSTQKEKCKILSGNKAEKKLKEILERNICEKYGTKSNQNFYYGDFKKTIEKDINGLPVYLQLRKNLNGRSEVIGKVETKILSLVSG